MWVAGGVTLRLSSVTRGHVFFPSVSLLLPCLHFPPSPFLFITLCLPWEMARGGYFYRLILGSDWMVGRAWVIFFSFKLLFSYECCMMFSIPGVY